MNAHSRALAAAGVVELHRPPYRPLPKYPAATAVLHVGDHVDVMFSRCTPAGRDLRGMVTQIYVGDRYKVEIVGDCGGTYAYSAPRELLRLVRRGDA